ncbi:uncharacterized protein BP01DRAFT_386554 [Aspergillus saccharolyticus JOP 1030-1]|uniref:Uncharacterized protein n=1 Tax=Aspergillus saccharolyticus JOP 1030-1 TaxID=1450539 RepID=A0A318Z2I8_9EURO|nr:hypothetical protein BP01DRAFT_386554 [Aspergillus saccharolyticus JOP 1030-1]PYH41276.1 hypothetical protein BP01DRAFT_386554 [Aspergillus saccharolyticus JOP 1030-1]
MPAPAVLEGESSLLLSMCVVVKEISEELNHPSFATPSSSSLLPLHSAQEADSTAPAATAHPLPAPFKSVTQNEDAPTKPPPMEVAEEEGEEKEPLPPYPIPPFPETRQTLSTWLKTLTIHFPPAEGFTIHPSLHVCRSTHTMYDLVVVRHAARPGRLFTTVMGYDRPPEPDAWACRVRVLRAQWRRGNGVGEAVCGAVWVGGLVRFFSG